MMNRLNRYLGQALTVVGAAALLAMMLHVNADVIGKYVFNSPVPLTMEMVSYYYMVAVALLPLAALERGGKALVHVELAYDRMPARVQRVLLPLALIVAAVYCAGAAYAAWEPAVSAYESGSYAGSTITVITWPGRFFPVIGFAALAVVLAVKSTLLVVGLVSGIQARKDSRESGASHG